MQSIELRLEAFGVRKARYAKGLLAVSPRKDGSGYKTREARLAEHFSRRYTGRENAYLLSVGAYRKLIAAYAAGRDASPITGEMR
jgi:hypothetical protein